jgi:DNA invertase Pin-like site-specific DNA recombinase
MSKRKLRVVGYVRVSQVNGRTGERFISPKVQRETIAGFVGGRGHELVTVETDLDESGGSLDRPGLQRVLAILEAGEADAICVARLDRLSRRVIEGLGLVQQVTAMGSHVLLADLDLDSSTPTGKAMLAVALAFAELELDQRRASWAIAQRNALARNVYPGSTPIGYTRDEDGRMVPDPVAGPAVRELYERRAGGESWAKLARWFDTRLPRKDGTPWRPTTVREMLRTPVNIGRLERRVGDELVVVDGAHEPLVDRATYEAAIAPGISQGPRHRAEPAKLAGLARCGTCGGNMSRAGSGTKKPYESYICTTRCAARARISLPALDQHVLGLLVERLATSEQVAGVRLRKGTGDVREAEAALVEAEGELNAYTEAVSVADVGAEAFGRGARRRREAVDEARTRLAEASRRAGSEGPDYADLLARLPGMSDGQVNAELRTLVRQVIVAKAGRPGLRGDLSERVRVVWADEEGSQDAARLGHDLRREGSAVAA